MSTLPASHPRLSQHLSDPALAPLLSSAVPNTPQFAALSALATASIAAYESAKKLGLGLPQRIIVETTRNGPWVLHSCLAPPRSNLQGAELIAADAGASAATGITDDVLGITREALRPVSAETEESAKLALEPEGQGLGLRFGNNADTPDVGNDEGRLVGGEEAEVNSQGLLQDGLDKGKERAETMPLGAKADEVQLAPLLVSTVVAPSHELAGEARRTAARLERIGLEFQKTWVRERVMKWSEDKENQEADGLSGNVRDFFNEPKSMDWHKWH